MFREGKIINLIIATFLCTLLSASSALAVTVNFAPTDIGGGIIGSATAEVTSGTNGGNGYLDILLTNTSPQGLEVETGKYANPFITELEFMALNDWDLDEANSNVQAVAGTYISDGFGNPVIGVTTTSSPLAVGDSLYYNLVDADTPGMGQCFMSGGEADNQRNDNTLASMNALSGGYPLEHYAQGFLNPSPQPDSGAIFDSALFHFEFLGPGPDADLFANGEWATLVVKFVGGGDYSYKHVGNGAIIPEPASLLLLGSGLVGLIGLRKKIK